MNAPKNPTKNGPTVSNCALLRLNPSSLTMEGRNNARPPIVDDDIAHSFCSEVRNLECLGVEGMSKYPARPTQTVNSPSWRRQIVNKLSCFERINVLGWISKPTLVYHRCHPFFESLLLTNQKVLQRAAKFMTDKRGQEFFYSWCSILTDAVDKNKANLDSKLSKRRGRWDGENKP